MFLSEVADKSFCLKFSGLISKLKILEKSYKSCEYSTYRLLLGLFLKLTIYGVPMKPSELFCFKDTENFATLLFFLVACNKKFQWQMRQISRRMKVIHPLTGRRRDEHRIHKHTHGSWILTCSHVSRVRSKTMHFLKMKK